MPFNIHLHANTCCRRWWWWWGGNSCLTVSSGRASESYQEAWLLHVQQEISSSPNDEPTTGPWSVHTVMSQSWLP